MIGNFLIAGNDKKMTECKKRLTASGFNGECKTGEEFYKSISLYENIILPLPTVANGVIAYTGKTVDDIKSALAQNQRVFFGNLSPDTFDLNGYSYYYDEAFLIKNSRLTAQGVLQIILDSLNRDISSVRVAVLGFGRCGKAVCRLLKSCGFNVTSFSRKRESAVSAVNYGCNVSKIAAVDEKISGYDIIVNTVPSNIISEKGLEKLTRENLYIEVASKPYGFDISKADVYNFKYVLAESLPGRFTPVSAGVNIADTVLEILKEVKYG